MDNKKCPICEIDLSHPFPLFCEQCGWDLKHDITLVPSLHEIPENILENYQKRAEISRKIWMERLEAVKKQKELEEKNEKLCAENKSLQAEREVDEKRKIPEKTDIMIGGDTRIIQLDPNDAVTYYNRGVVHYENGQYDKAIAYYTRAIQLSPKYARAYSSRAVAYKKLDKHEEAESDFRKARELSGN